MKWAFAGGAVFCGIAALQVRAAAAAARSTDRKNLEKGGAISLVAAGASAYVLWGVGYVLGFARKFSLLSVTPGNGAWVKGLLLGGVLKFTPLASITPGGKFSHPLRLLRAPKKTRHEAHP